MDVDIKSSELCTLPRELKSSSATAFAHLLDTLEIPAHQAVGSDPACREEQIASAKQTQPTCLD